MAVISKPKPRYPVRANYARPRRLDGATWVELGAPKPFIGFRCDRCRRGLWDDHGNPRWAIEGCFLLVCASGCGVQ